jgi:hypothetical protein
VHSLRRLAPIARALVGVGLGGALGAVTFLIVANQAQEHGDTSLRFNHALGLLVGGQTQDVTAHGRLGVVGDTAGPRGLYVTLLSAALLVAIYGVLLEPRFRGRRWALGGVALAAATFLVVGLVYGPLVESRVPRDDAVAGLFGVDAGVATPLWLGLASLAFGVVAARVYGLARSPGWWRKEREALGDRIGDVMPAKAPAPSSRHPRM